MDTHRESINRYDVALLLMRLMLATVFIYHGSQKLFGAFDGHGVAGLAAFNAQLGIPLPTVGAWAAASAEFFGGLALLTGVLVRLAVVPMIVTMLVASFVAHSGFNAQTGGMEYSLTLAVMLTALGIAGAGRLTVPNALRYFRSEPSPAEAIS